MEQHFRDFLVEVILAQGTGGDSWKPIMKTIDLLVWSAQPGKVEADREKLDQIREKLLANLEKALKIVGVDQAEISSILNEVRAVQDNSFKQDGTITPREEIGVAIDELYQQDAGSKVIENETPVDDRFLQETNDLPIGIWMEFTVDGEHTIRCTLAAKMTSPDNYVFVNRQGVKVIEKSIAGVARELEAGTARQISESVLIDRAIDTVIARLRARNENQARIVPGLNSAA